MSDLERCLNVIEGLRRGNCWCARGLDPRHQDYHTGACQGAAELLKENGRYVPDEQKDCACNGWEHLTSCPNWNMVL